MKRMHAKMWLTAWALLAVACSTDGNFENTEIAYLNDGNQAEGVMAPDLPGISQQGDQFAEFTDNPFVATAQQPVSTFSVDADGASYGLMRRMLNNHYDISPNSVRIEEFLNYFTFNYAQPTGTQTVAINAEVGDCPWNGDHKLLRLGIKGKELKASEVPLANYVFLVDVSGSMQGSDRLDLLKSGLTQLLFHLNPDDRISLITYSGEVQKLLESTPVSEADKIKSAIQQLHASGSTAGGEALKMAYEEAMANYDSHKNNRIIMGTDGDFNVGVTSTEALVEMVESYASKGIYLTCLGFGLGNFNDSMMETISNKGNGNYHYIDCEDEMMKVLVHERQRFVCVANDAKCQVSFNPDLISEYRLIGYENRVMNREDFEDDKKDAGEIGAGQTITALYEIVLNEDFWHRVDFNPSAYPDLITFDFRYKKSLDGTSIPLKCELTADHVFNKAGRSSDFYFAAGVAAYGMLLRNSPYKGDATYDMAASLVKEGSSFDPDNRRSELLELISKAKEK